MMLPVSSLNEKPWDHIIQLSFTYIGYPYSSRLCLQIYTKQRPDYMADMVQLTATSATRPIHSASHQLHWKLMEKTKVAQPVFGQTCPAAWNILPSCIQSAVTQTKRIIRLVSFPMFINSFFNVIIELWNVRRTFVQVDTKQLWWWLDHYALFNRKLYAFSLKLMFFSITTLTRVRFTSSDRYALMTLSRIAAPGGDFWREGTYQIRIRLVVYWSCLQPSTELPSLSWSWY